MNQVERSRLHKLLNDSFNKSELGDLCFRVGIDHEELSSQNKNDLIWETISYCIRRDLVDVLLEQCRLLRPALNWPNYKGQLTMAFSLQKKVLIVEDDPEWQSHIKSCLSEVGFVCEIVAEYILAFKKLHMDPPSAIVLDLHLDEEERDEGELSGHKLAKEAHSKGIPLVIVSGDSQPDIIIKSFTEYKTVHFFDKVTFLEKKRDFVTCIIKAVYK